VGKKNTADTKSFSGVSSIIDYSNLCDFVFNGLMAINFFAILFKKLSKRIAQGRKPIALISLQTS